MTVGVWIAGKAVASSQLIWALGPKFATYPDFKLYILQ